MKKMVIGKSAKESGEEKTTALLHVIAKPVCWLLGVTVVIAGLVGCLLCYQSTEKCMQDSLTETAAITQKYIQNEIDKVSGFLSVLAESESVYNLKIPATAKNAALTAKAEEYGCQSAIFVTPNGIDETTGTDYSAQEYFKQAKSGNTFVTSPYADSDGQLIMMFSTPVWADGVKNSTLAGVLCVKMPQSIINNLVASIKIGEHGLAYIVDNEGYTIADQDVNLVKNKENIQAEGTSPTLAALIAKARAGESGYGTYSYQGVTKKVFYAPIEGTNGWSLMIAAVNADFMGGIKTTIVVMIGLCILSLLLSLVIIRNIARKLTQPLDKIQNRMSTFADGDLNSPLEDFDVSATEFNSLRNSIEKTLENSRAVVSDIDYTLSHFSQGDLTVTPRTPEMFVGDYGPIYNSLMLQRTNLSQSVRSIATAAEQVNSGASQVSSGAQTLAQGATEQASSVQELSASIQEVAQEVKLNAEEADQAKNLTASTIDIMQLSVEDMELARRAMEEISATSKNISKVIKAIDDIAFQTNILALNAAVEAARAGSAGKGFAVVADEVRNLSQKSAEAAKNTTVLIESSIGAVEKGTGLVNKTSDGFTEVAEKATRINTLIENISVQAQQQAATIEQISAGVDQVSSVVQMNSATSEESAAASEELSSQAVTLKSLVDHFQLPDE